MAKKKSIEVKRYCKESREYSMMGNCGSPIDGDGEIDDLCERLNFAPDGPQEAMREALTRWRDFARANGWTDADHHDADGTGWITMTEKALAGPQEGEDTHISDGYCPEHGLVKTVDDAGIDKCPDCGRATSFDAEEAERFEHQDDDPMNVSSVVCPEAVRGSAAWQNDLRIKELEAIIAKEGISELNGAVFQVDDDGKLIEDIATCGTCGKSWNDALITGRTPAPSGRCPYEHIHAEIKELARLKRQ